MFDGLPPYVTDDDVTRCYITDESLSYVHVTRIGDVYNKHGTYDSREGQVNNNDELATSFATSPDFTTPTT